MEKIRLEFDFSDKKIAEIIANSKPPDGVTISKPTSLIKASGDIGEGGGVFASIVIQFAHDVHDMAIGFLSAWLYDCCVKSGKKHGRINHNKIVFNKRNISRLIKKELKKQNAHNTQRPRDKNRSPKKRS